MPAIPGTIPLTGQVAPTDTTDSFPTHDAQWGKDGLRSVADNTARNALTTERRVEGMLVYTQDTNKYWSLNASPWAGTDADWTELVFGGVPATVSVALIVGTTVLDTVTLATTDAVQWYVVLLKGNVRYSAFVTATHDGTVSYSFIGMNVLTPGTIDASFSVDVSGATMRLIGTAASLGWTVRYQRTLLGV